MWIIVAVVVVIVLISIRQVNQYERGVKFMLGRYIATVEPGWRLVFPIIQSMHKVDIRIRAVDVPDQDAITRDNVSVTINAVIYYKISDAAKAVIEVENSYYAVSQLAQTTMRNTTGEVTLDELLANRDEISNRIREVVDKATDQWGIEVHNLELKDIVLPDTMKRTIAKQAEAERERRAVIINSEGEISAAENLAKAAGILSANPGALHLRTLHSINDISSDQSNTVVFVAPIEVLKAIEGFAKKG
jgi:regulator of protease activity HflC (stomatin/prohibitin superfamily)